MKTPEEIKKGLECCYSPVEPMLRCEACPYSGSILCKMRLHADALAYIQQLEAKNSELVRKTEQLKEGASFTLTVKEQDVKGAVKKAYESFEIDGKKLSEWIKLLADYKRQDWISVEDRLPEAKLAVLAYGRRHIRKTETTELPAPHVAYTRGEDEGWFTWDYGDYVYVSHWMPLPEPPKEETGHV